MTVNALKAYNNWLALVKDPTLLQELEGIKDNTEEIENRFYKELEFGTAGLRGIIGAGTNCLNIYTVRKATQGLARYIAGMGGGSVAISYDSRINSQLFAQTAAAVLCGSGIRVHICAQLMPTPFLSYAVRELGAVAGIMVTASHNPAKYNGYKVYGSDGCQMTDAFAQQVIDKAKSINPFEVEPPAFDDCVSSGLVKHIDDSIIENYLQRVAKQSMGDCRGLNVTYTPLNGTGYKLVPLILKRQGVESLQTVDVQAQPDGNFTTCPYPNPEKEEALSLAIKKAEECGSDIALATDPDADRVGIAVIDAQGEYQLMTGNEVGVLLTDYLLAAKKTAGTLHKKPIVIKTIVTSTLTDKVAKSYGAEVWNVLTGFKYIGEKIGLLESRGEEDRLVIAFEESYGYLAGSYVRDKDAVLASMLICEMAAKYKREGKTLLDRLQQIYHEHGTYSHKTLTKDFPGASGSQKMQELLSSLRKEKPADIGGLSVQSTVDYLLDDTGLPQSDVLEFNLNKGAQLIIRPSGTEPLIKFYLTSSLNSRENAHIFAKLKDFIDKFFV